MTLRLAHKTFLKKKIKKITSRASREQPEPNPVRVLRQELHTAAVSVHAGLCQDVLCQTVKPPQWISESWFADGIINRWTARKSVKPKLHCSVAGFHVWVTRIWLKMFWIIRSVNRIQLDPLKWTDRLWIGSTTSKWIVKTRKVASPAVMLV